MVSSSGAGVRLVGSTIPGRAVKALARLGAPVAAWSLFISRPRGPAGTSVALATLGVREAGGSTPSRIQASSATISARMGAPACSGFTGLAQTAPRAAQASAVA